MDAWLVEMKASRKETTACQEATDSCLERKEPTPVEMARVAIHPQVPVEEMDSGRWWVRTEIGRRPQTADPQCRSCTT
jgi:hypothetical protein